MRPLALEEREAQLEGVAREGRVDVEIAEEDLPGGPATGVYGLRNGDAFPGIVTDDTGIFTAAGGSGVGCTLPGSSRRPPRSAPARNATVRKSRVPAASRSRRNTTAILLSAPACGRPGTRGPYHAAPSAWKLRGSKIEPIQLRGRSD